MSLNLILTMCDYIGSSSYILTFGNSGDEVIPNSFITEVKNIVSEFGGKVTHEYALIKGFTMDIPSDVVPNLKQKLELVEKKFGYSFNLERDSEVHALVGHEH
ncbi:hypothetical protein Kpol_1039p60 [Vanderwaltozyma polyspora DSM 70294]|uniref:Inhibitor I9 domain-containing protein n=1 Tax=Vanderwaltozyma polyspora (strain ATCC 22028 / DSM 70294 / BCRC 21397 / CBS 2163 / NBRC 10782 / NRRL Y-8283 / UCD 57-17) TaxID=436907 RepID=A7THI5_VANPO|nr:uncharacterized protein Kpol_1039p60 [Vanderwaltozyma polyspora DSM 70294]EDO18309.1 hypothetical protein Kpol_1039p60 [Vanderwaltozyma polyspora DSM 70294]